MNSKEENQEKDIEKKFNQEDNENTYPENNQIANKYLPSIFSFDEDYFKNNSVDEEESNEEKSFENKKGNSTKENSNNFLNNSQNDNYFYQNNNNNFNQNNSNQNYYFNDNNNLIYNQNNNNHLNLNYLNGINNNNLNYQYFCNNNSNSFNNQVFRNWNSFSGLNSLNLFNFNNSMNNNYSMSSFNSDLNMNINPPLKCFSFNQKEIPINIENNNSNFKIKKYKSKNQKMMNEVNTIPSINKLLDMNTQDLYNYIITQKGSRESQNILKKVNKNEVELLISKLKNYFSDITLDKYGNYFSRKLIQICVPSQRIQLLESMKGRFVEIANNSFGTHPLQNLIEIINMPEEKKLILSYILNNESELALDSKGSHVLQKFISGTKGEERIELNNNLINLIDKLIVNPFGVCVLIQLIKHTKDKNINQKLANYITSGDPLYYIQHPYANYAVQILITNTDLSFCDEIIDTIVKNYLSLSMQKYSSNVVENCIKYGKESTIKKIFKNIIEQEKLESLLNNNYGIFVLEKLIAKLNKEEKIIFIKKIEKLGKTKIIPNSIKVLLYK